MTIFAELGIDDVVVNVIVAEQSIIDDLPNKESFIETRKNDKFFKRQYAGIGYTYDRIRDVFIEPKPCPSWTLNADGFWESPTNAPLYDKQLHVLLWNEIDKTWSLSVRRNGF